jgi:branched-chain amino acid transport system substrate-binding protein
MSKLVVLQISDSAIAEEFMVTLRISEDGREFFSHSGKIPSADRVFQSQNNWCNAYYNLTTIRNARITRIQIAQEQTTNISHQDIESSLSDEERWKNYHQAAQDFQKEMREWLDQRDFWILRTQVLQQLRGEKAARIIIATKNRQFWKLPWHLWDLFNYGSSSEPAISNQDYVNSPVTSLFNPVKILSIFGNDTDINLVPDRKLLSRLENQGASITWLKKPTRQEFREQLSDQSWDILFFAGHSYSPQEGNAGVIQLNQNEQISLGELTHSFKEAVQKGLKLAIFNSCDGLGLARVLSEANLPHIVVMREPVPDQVAQRFLEYFLNSFSQGKSLNESVQKARSFLQEDETDYQLPCASWLPVIYENPTVPPLIWNQSEPSNSNHQQIALDENETNTKKHSLNRSVKVIPKPLKLTLGLFSVSILTLILGSFFLHLNTINVYERLSEGDKLLVTTNSTLEKKQGVEAFKQEDYALAAQRFAASLKKYKNDPESLIYLNNAKIGSQSAYKIAVSVPIGKVANVAEEMLRGVAQAQERINISGGINGKFLKVVIANDDNDPKTVIKIANTFVENQQILAVIGHNSSDASVVAAPIYNDGGLVMITPTSFADQLSSKGEYVFRLVPAVSFFADPLADYAIGTAKKTKMAICYPWSASDNVSFALQFRDIFIRKGGNYIAVDCNFDQSNFNAKYLINKIVSTGADSLLLAPHVNRIEQAVEIAQANQGRLTLFGSPTLYTQITLNKGGQAVNGLVAVTPWVSEQLSQGDRFLNEASQLWGGRVNWRTAESYDTTNLIATALQQNATRAGIKEAIKSIEFQGVTGKVKFLPSGDRVAEKGLIVQIQPNPKVPSRYEFVLLKR